MAADYSDVKSGQFTVAILDAPSGRLLARSEAISLGQPAGYIPEGLPLVEATVHDREIRLTWSTSSRYRAGAPPPIQRANIPPREMVHSVTIDSATAHVKNESVEPATRIDTDRQVAGNRVEYLRGSEWTHGRWLTGDNMADLVEMNSGGRSKLELQILDRVSGKIKKTVVLGSSASISDPRVSGDGAYVMIPDGKKRDQAWRIFNANTGIEIGLATLDADAREICVLEPQLYYLTGTSGKSLDVVLRAVDLRSDRKVWEHSLGERRPGRPPRLPQ